MNGNEPMHTDQPMQPDGLDRNEPTMPLTVGDFGAEHGMDALAGGETGKRVKSGTILVVLVIAVAIGGLISMRTLTKVTAAHSGTTEIEKTLENWLAGIMGDGETPGNALTDGNDEALGVLSAPYSEQQVPLNDIAKNPFVLPGDSEFVASKDPVDTALAERDRLIAAARSTIERAAGRLEVKTIMWSDNPLANVSGQIVQNDDVIVADEGGETVEFVVKSMTTDVVTIVARRPEFDLTVEVELDLERD